MEGMIIKIPAEMHRNLSWQYSSDSKRRHGALCWYEASGSRDSSSGSAPTPGTAAGIWCTPGASSGTHLNPGSQSLKLNAKSTD